MGAIAYSFWMCSLACESSCLPVLWNKGKVSLSEKAQDDIVIMFYTKGIV